jgi:hypothetical protein
MMHLCTQAALAAPPRLLDWFNTPARQICGGLVLLIVLLVLIEIVRLTPDLVRYIRMKRM